MPERLHVLAGDCTVTDCGDRTRTYRGHVVVLVKPDNTTLVHDADGYQPVAWLTRPEDAVVETMTGRPARTASLDQSVDCTGESDGNDQPDHHEQRGPQVQFDPIDRTDVIGREGGNGLHGADFAHGSDRIEERECIRDPTPTSHQGSTLASIDHTASRDQAIKTNDECTKSNRPQDRIDDTDTPQTGFRVIARDGSRQLTVVSTSATTQCELPVTDAGIPVGNCPEDDGALVRAGGEVVCLDCTNRWGLPTGASVTDTTCETCGLPKFRVERGRPFHLCLDPSCDPLPIAVRDRFDREWGCPDCAGDLRVRSAPGRVYLACEHDDTCGRTVSFPHGVLIDECACGQPVFETGSGRRCLDQRCNRPGGVC